VSPGEFISRVLGSYDTTPDGKVGVVSVGSRTGETKSPVAAFVEGVKSVAHDTLQALSPANVFVPGGSQAAKAAASAAKDAGSAVKSVAGAAAAGIESGFSKVTIIVLLIGGFILYRLLKEVTG